MIVVAFSTLGKTYLHNAYPRVCVDLEYGKLRKMGLTDPEIAKLADDLSESGRTVTLTRPDPIPFLRGKVVIACPSYGVDEFKRRLKQRYGDLQHSEEWAAIGHRYDEAVRAWGDNARPGDLVVSGETLAGILRELGYFVLA